MKTISIAGQPDQKTKKSNQSLRRHMGAFVNAATLIKSPMQK